MNSKKIKRFLTKNFKDTSAKSLYERYETLYYDELIAAYEKLIQKNTLNGVIDAEKEIIDLGLREIIINKRKPNSDYIVHDVVLTALEQRRDEKVAKEFTDAVINGNDDKLEDILENCDPDGKYRDLIINSFQ